MSQSPATTSTTTTGTASQLSAGQLPSYADEHDPSWEEVIAMVVIPGHAEAISSAAGNWDLLLSRVQSVSGHLQELSSQLTSWEGAAGETYRAHLKELSDGLDEIATTHQHVPQSLRQAADDVNTALNKIPIPDELVDEALRARAQFKATGQLTTTFHQGFFADKLFPGFMDLAGDIFGFLTFGLADKASDMLRDFLSDGDDKAKQAYQELNGQHTGTQTSMAAAATNYDQLQVPFPQPTTTNLARTAPPSGAPGTGSYGTGLQGAGGGPIAASSLGGSTGLGSIGGGSGAAGIGGIGAGGGGLGGGAGGGSGIRPGGLTSAGSAIRGTPTPMAGRGTGAAGARAGGAGAGAGRAGGMGGMPMGGAGGGAAGARAGGSGSRTGVPGVAAGKAGGPGGKAGGAGRGGMMGAGGGAHGGGAGDATDHSTWLQEDEDVWGTDSDAAPPVLGS